MDDKKKVEFTESRTVEDHTGKTVASFEAGKRYSLPAASADRWIRRGVAFDVNDQPDEEEAGTGETVDRAKKAAAAAKASGK